MVLKKGYITLLVAFFLLNIMGWLESADAKYGIPSIFKYVFSIFGLAVLLFLRIKNKSKPQPGGFFYPVILIFVLWSILLMILSLLGFDGFFYFQRLFGQSYFFIPYLLPILLLFTKFDLDFYSSYFYYSFYLLILALIIQIYIVLFAISTTNWVDQTSFINFFDIGTGFLLLTSHIVKKKYVSYTVLLYYCIWILMWSVYGRRGMLIQTLLLLISMIILRLRTSFIKRSERMKMYYSGLVLLLLVLMFGYLFTSTYVFQRGFNKDAFEMSRGTVIESFFFDFKSTSDWILGRGLDGTVLRSSFTDERFSSIENGFLTILLKGGLLYLIPFVLIFLRAIYLGLFKSRNDLVKAMAFILFIELINMNAFGVPDYSSRYIFIWIFVSCCFVPEIRNWNNEEVYETINSRFK